MGDVADRVAVVAPGGGYGAAVVFGKSLGSLAAPVVAECGLAAVWFTPLLTNPDVVAGLHQAVGPFLLAGGTADEYWMARTTGCSCLAGWPTRRPCSGT
jgi:hypothetical protein